VSKLIQSGEAKKLDTPQFPAVSLLELAGHWLAGKAAGASGDARAMIGHLEKAVAAEDALPCMEPACWPLPVRPTLGSALLQSGDAIRAEQTFREDLKRWPRNGWGLFGLEQSLRAQGKNEAAEDVRRQFQKVWKNADVKLNLSWF